MMTSSKDNQDKKKDEQQIKIKEQIFAVEKGTEKQVRS